MKEFVMRSRNTFLLIFIMCSAFGISLLISNIFDDESLIPAVLMLAVFIISLVNSPICCIIMMLYYRNLFLIFKNY